MKLIKGDSPISSASRSSDPNTNDQQPVQHKVDYQKKNSCLEKKIGGGIRIDKGNDIMVYESSPIPLFPRLAQQDLLQRGQRAGGIQKLNSHAPDDRGKVRDGHPMPPPHQQGPSDHKDDEGKVHYKD
jgi:hypothetical protein